MRPVPAFACNFAERNARSGPSAAVSETAIGASTMASGPKAAATFASAAGSTGLKLAVTRVPSAVNWARACTCARTSPAASATAAVPSTPPSSRRTRSAFRSPASHTNPSIASRTRTPALRMRTTRNWCRNGSGPEPAVSGRAGRASSATTWLPRPPLAWPKSSCKPPCSERSKCTAASSISTVRGTSRPRSICPGLSVTRARGSVSSAAPSGARRSIASRRISIGLSAAKKPSHASEARPIASRSPAPASSGNSRRTNVEMSIGPWPSRQASTQPAMTKSPSAPITISTARWAA